MSSHNRNISKINLEGKSVGDLCVEAKTRDLTFLIDEPLAIGGTNLGPSPTESALASLMSCVSMVIRVIAKKKKLDVSSANVDLDADFDLRGVFFKEEVDVPFKKVHLKIKLTANINENELLQIQQGVRKFCPLHKLFSMAGTEIEETWQIN